MRPQTILSLFNGMSCGNLALDKAKIPIDKYYSSEIEKRPIAVTQYNYPNTIQLGSVVDVDVSELEPIEILVGGSPCFVAGTKIITDKEYKNIEDVVVGDFVLTHKGNYKKVLRTGNTHSPTIIVRAQGVKPTETTLNHPYYTREKAFKYLSRKLGKKKVLKDKIFLNVEDFTDNTNIAIPILKTSSNPLSITKEEAFIIGRYIADGHTRKDYKNRGDKTNRHWQLILSIGNSKIDNIKDIIKENHYSLYPHTKSTNRMVFSNKRLVKIVEKHCGCGAKNKKISMTLLNLPIHLLEKIIDGYISGDGHTNKNSVVSAVSISSELIQTLNLAVAKVYNYVGSYMAHLPAKTKIIEGRLVNQSPQYLTTFKKKNTKDQKFIVDNDMMWVNTQQPTVTGFIKSVYNLEVEEDNSYTANNAIVHNCQSFSFAGKMAGMSTKCETGGRKTNTKEIIMLKTQKN